MPDTRAHRGPHPADAELFSENWLPALKAAIEEFSWLLTRGYSPLSSLKLVGDRHALRERQRDLVLRASCTDGQKTIRRASRLLPFSMSASIPCQKEAASPIQQDSKAGPENAPFPDNPALVGQNWFIDGFNLLITLEAALGGGLIFKCRDSAVRDLASVHGTYRSVEETESALLLAGEALAPWKPASVTWLFDSPVSNSGRIAQKVRDLANSRSWPWEVGLSKNPDADLMELPAGIIVTTDSLILDHVSQGWFPLSEHIFHHRVSPTKFQYLDFSGA